MLAFAERGRDAEVGGVDVAVDASGKDFLMFEAAVGVTIFLLIVFRASFSALCFSFVHRPGHRMMLWFSGGSRMRDSIWQIIA